MALLNSDIKHDTVTASTFKDVGGDSAPLAVLHGVQNMKIEENTMDGANAAKLTITTGKPKTALSGNTNAAGEAVSALIIEDLRK